MASNCTLVPSQGRTSGSSSPYRRPPSSTTPRPESRKVTFKDGAEDAELYEASPKLPPKEGATTSLPTAKASKWQPLSSVDPSPIGDNDPFSLGDSEDEKEPKDKRQSKEMKPEEAQRLKQATADAMADSLMDKPKTEDAAGGSKND